MNTLFRHIEYLLTRHDCVIVPGLGAFIVTTVSATIDRVNRRVNPPSRSIMFNQAVTVDDGLLANSFARCLNLSFEEARQVILKDVSAYLDTLHSMGRCNAGKLGAFSLGEENQLIFTPRFSASESAEQSGLYSFTLSSSKSSQDFKAGAEESLVNSVEVNENGNLDKQYFHFRINRSAIRFTAIFIFLLAVTLSVLIYPVPHDEREHRASVVPVEALIPSPHQAKSTQAAKDTVVPVTVKAEIDNAEIIPTSTDAKSEYYLIVATFHSKKEAQRFVSLYSSTDYPLDTVSSKKVTRVFVATSNDKHDLLPKLNSSEMAKRFPNSWIWSNKD